MKLEIPSSNESMCANEKSPLAVTPQGHDLALDVAQLDNAFPMLAIETEGLGPSQVVGELQTRLNKLSESVDPSSQEGRSEILSILSTVKHGTGDFEPGWEQRQQLNALLVESPLFRDALKHHSHPTSKGSEKFRKVLGPSLDDLVLKILEDKPNILPQDYNLKPAKKILKKDATEHSFFTTEGGNHVVMTNRFFNKEGEVVDTQGKKAAFGGAQGKVRHGVWFSQSDSENPKPAAVKKASLRRRGITGDNRLSFAREAYYLGLCEGPNVIKLYDSFAGDNQKAYLIAEAGNCALGSDDARALIKNNLSALKRLTADSLNGLAAIHTQGVMHRDIKPDNLILVDGITKIGDFGLATLDDSTSKVAGTAAYNSADSQQTAKTDIFALGLTLIELYYGIAPDPDGWSSLDNTEIIHNSTPLNDFLQIMLEPDPSKRPTAQQLLKHPFLKDPPKEALPLRGGPLVNLPTSPEYKKTAEKLMEFSSPKKKT